MKRERKKGELALQIGVKEAARIGGENAAAGERVPYYMKQRERAAARRKRLGISR